ncbi:MAG: NAD(P)-dependent oxidoreductase [Candidatus Didemnitutus sp.]|nr:NAD(P)-dependent oxidoreductase [Candidatus Didemnitutus sp.]
MADLSAIGLRRPPADPSSVDLSLSHPDAGVARAMAALNGPVLVLGAGGKIGLHLCLMLRAAAQQSGRDLRVVAVSRFKTLRDRETFAVNGVETIAADLSVQAEVAKLPDAPTVFFLAGVKFGTSDSPGLLEAMNVIMPRLVAERYAHSLIVAFSTGCVYPFVDFRSGGANESTPTAPVGAYAESCLRREHAFAEVARRSPNARVVLVRLNYSVEYRYGVLLDIATKVFQREPVDVTMGYVNVIWQRDAVSQIIQSTALAGNPPVPINITGAETHSVRSLAEKFGRVFGVKPIVVGQESPTAWLSDASESHRRFGRPAHDIDAMVGDVAAWIQNGGDTWRKPTGFEKRDGQF